MKAVKEHSFKPMINPKSDNILKKRSVIGWRNDVEGSRIGS